MNSGGEMGQRPEWFRVIQAARYLGVEPWVLAEQPLFWTEAAEHAQHAEAKQAEFARRRK